MVLVVVVVLCDIFGGVFALEMYAACRYTLCSRCCVSSLSLVCLVCFVLPTSIMRNTLSYLVANRVM